MRSRQNTLKAIMGKYLCNSEWAIISWTEHKKHYRYKLGFSYYITNTWDKSIYKAYLGSQFWWFRPWLNRSCFRSCCHDNTAHSTESMRWNELLPSWQVEAKERAQGQVPQIPFRVTAPGTCFLPWGSEGFATSWCHRLGTEFSKQDLWRWMGECAYKPQC